MRSPTRPAGPRRFGPLLAAIVGPQGILLAGFLCHAPPSDAHARLLPAETHACASVGVEIGIGGVAGGVGDMTRVADLRAGVNAGALPPFARRR